MLGCQVKWRAAFVICGCDDSVEIYSVEALKNDSCENVYPLFFFFFSFKRWNNFLHDLKIFTGRYISAHFNAY